jgi:cytochrome c556
MDKRRFGTIAFALWVVTIAVAAALWTTGRLGARLRDTHASASDVRQPVVLPYDAREAVLSGMREMTASLHGVMVSCAKGDTAGIRRAAAQSGMAMALGPGLTARLPEGFVRLADRAHRGFDAVAEAAGMPKDSVAARMAVVTTTCVTCHAAYRLVTE